MKRKTKTKTAPRKAARKPTPAGKKPVPPKLDHGIATTLINARVKRAAELFDAKQLAAASTKEAAFQEQLARVHRHTVSRAGVHKTCHRCPQGCKAWGRPALQLSCEHGPMRPDVLPAEFGKEPVPRRM